MPNYWFIGDIHGELRLLEKLLDGLLRFNPDQLVFVGDYIDRGTYSKQVIDRIMELDVPFFCLMGNHEMMMLNAIEDLGYGYSPMELWYYNGGEATLQSFGSNSFFDFRSSLEPKYLAFFRGLKMSHVVSLGEKFRVFATHAGISPSIPVREHLQIKDYMALNRYMLEKHLEPGDSFLWVREAFFGSSPDLWKGYLVVHGHTPVLKLKRFIAANGSQEFLFVENDLCIRKEKNSGRICSIDIDSGSVISGRLSALGFFLEDREIRMRSLTVSGEEVFPRDLGVLTQNMES